MSNPMAQFFIDGGPLMVWLVLFNLIIWALLLAQLVLIKQLDLTALVVTAGLLLFLLATWNAIFAGKEALEAVCCAPPDLKGKMMMEAMTRSLNPFAFAFISGFPLALAATGVLVLRTVVTRAEAKPRAVGATDVG